VCVRLHRYSDVAWKYLILYCQYVSLNRKNKNIACTYRIQVCSYRVARVIIVMQDMLILSVVMLTHVELAVNKTC
jgi:hypothetical protein